MCLSKPKCKIPLSPPCTNLLLLGREDVNTNDYKNLLNGQSMEWLSVTVEKTALSSESKGQGAGFATILGL